MTQPQDPLPPDPAGQPQPLSYATPPRNPAAGGMPYIAQTAIGCAAFWLVMALAVGTIVLLSNAGVDSRTIWSVIFGMGLAVLAVLSALAWTYWRWRGVLTGVLGGVLMVVLIIVGIVLLIWSICGGMKF